MIRHAFVRTGAMLLAILVTAGATPPAARPAPLDTVRVGRAIVNSFAFATLEVGQDAHMWDKVGIKLEISSFKGDGQLQQAMTAGTIDFGLGSGPAMGYRAKGVPAIAVAMMLGAPIDMAIIVSSNGSIKSVNDLKGKTLGVTTSGSLTDWLVHELARQKGWGSDGITSLAMGSTEARVAAMESGQIAGTVQDVGIGYELQEQGKGKVIETFGNFVPRFATHVIFATDDTVKNRSDVVSRFLKGWFMTVAFMKTHKNETVKSAMKVLDEPESVVSKLYDTVVPGLSTDGVFDPAAIAAVAKSLKELGITDTSPDPSTIYTTRFVPVKI